MQGSPRIDELRQKFHENPRRYFAPLANEYRKAGDPDQAIAICRAHLAQQPAHMSGHVVYGQALYDAKRSDEARTVFEKALTLDPDNAVVLRQLGHIAREKGETTEARHWYSKALDIDPYDTEVAAYVAELTEPVVTELEVSADSAAHAVPAPAVESTETGGDRDILQETEIDAEEAVEDATPAEQQGDGADPESPPVKPAEAATAENTFVMSEHAADPRIDLEDSVVELEAGESLVVDETPVTWQDLASMPAPQEEITAEPVAEDGAELVKEPVIESVAEPIVEPVAEYVAPVVEPEAPEPGTLAEQETSFVSADSSDTAEESDDEEQPQADVPVVTPFVTRTMAELYEAQGYRSAALDVYLQLAEQDPRDESIQERIRALSAETPEPDSSVATESPVDSPEGGESVEQPVASADTPVASIDTPAAEEPFSYAELSDEPMFPPGDEDLNLVPDALPPTGGKHFTESEIGVGDSWDTDQWGAGFSADDDVDEPAMIDFSDEPVTASPAATSETERATPEPESTEAPSAPAQETTAEMDLGEMQTSIDEAGMATTSPHDAAIAPAAIDDSFEPVHFAESGDAAVEIRGDEAAAAMVEEPPVEEPPVEEPPVEEPALVEETTATEEEESAVVAYSPEPPEEKDLAHFHPKSPSIREFFATLGARRPPSRDAGPSITAHAAVGLAQTETQAPADDLPLATDAFGGLFPDSPATEEDTRAAFALSGAMSQKGHNPIPSSVRTSPPQPAPAVTASTPEHSRESEEDIRRFREWLESLADS